MLHLFKSVEFNPDPILLEKLLSAISVLPVIEGWVTFMDKTNGFFFDMNLKNDIRVSFTKYIDEDENVYFNIWDKGNIVAQNNLPFNSFIDKLSKLYV